MQIDIINFCSGIALGISILSICLTWWIRKESKLNDKINSKKANIEKLKKEVMAYYLVEQQYMKYLAEKEGKSPKSIQIRFRDAAQKSEDNPNQLRPTMSFKDALNYTN